MPSAEASVPPGLSNIVAIAAAWNHSLALKNDGTVVAWGLNDSGQASVPLGLANVQAIAGNLSYSLALKKDGTVVGWGRLSAIPGNLTGVTAVAAGENYCLALRSDGSVVAWGADASSENAPPNALGSATAITAAWNFNTALIARGFRLLNPRWMANGFTASLLSQNGKTYVLEYRDSAAGSSWMALPSAVGTGGLLTLTDPAVNIPSRFYRVRTQ